MSEEQNIPETPTNPGCHLPEFDTQETEPKQPNTETKEMEIHHHPHAHHKKKWTDYLFEFLMLFLAVSAGFFVENQREHYIEHHRSKQYAAFLYSDLKNDTVHLKERTTFMVEGIQKLDTLITLLKLFNYNDTSTSRIYDLSAYVYSGVFFSATTSTLEQLKNSGSLRYFRSEDVIRNFSTYDTDLQRLKAVEDRNAYLNEETRKFLSQFLDLTGMSRFTVNTAADSSGFNLMQPSIPRSLKLYKKNPADFEQYANLCALKQLDWSTRIGLQTRLQNSAAELIAALKKEYRIIE